MVLQKRTKLGVLRAGYRPGDIYPGFWVNLWNDRNKNIVPVCVVEYNPEKNVIQVVVYGSEETDEPTHIIPVQLGSKEDVV